jgi:hypothetical protein
MAEPATWSISIAFALYAAFITFRYARFTPPIAKGEKTYLAILVGCLVADLLASYGFFVLIQIPPELTRTHNSILTGLALAAGIAVIGKFSFSREGAKRFPRLFTWAWPLALVFLFYLLFGWIAYESTIIRDTGYTALANIFIPVLMLSILWITTVFDHWDYAEKED